MNRREARIEALARRYVERGAYASMEWLVRRDGHEWLRGAVGMADPLNNTAPAVEADLPHLFHDPSRWCRQLR
ncbi:MAG: hypothetical protein R3D34_15455 [Nitratireductor sp.]